MARRTSSHQSHALNVLGPKIRACRLKRNWSQADLARRLQRSGWDIDPATLNRIEKQRRSLTDIEFLLIVRVLKTRVDQLLV
jgi:transcriptional regulator with XRE-family HTH domain